MASHANRKRRGTDRERAVKAWYEDKGWLAFRAPASLGCADVIAIRSANGLSEVHLLEVKSTAKGPYEHFGPKERQRLRAVALETGACALLAWWPPRKPLKLIEESEWP